MLSLLRLTVRKRTNVTSPASQTTHTHDAAPTATTMLIAYTDAYPHAKVRTSPKPIDSDGKATFDEELWLFVGPAATVHIEVYTQLPADKPAAAPRLVGVATAHVGGADTSGTRWCRVHGEPSSAEGDGGGGELQLLFERDAAAAASLRRPPAASSSATSTGASAESAQQQPSAASHAPCTDLQGFPLRVGPAEYEDFVRYYWLRCERQLQAWAPLTDGPVFGTGRGSDAQSLSRLALGIPAMLRPTFWLLLSGAESMRLAAGDSSSYQTFLEPEDFAPQPGEEAEASGEEGAAAPPPPPRTVRSGLGQLWAWLSRPRRTVSAAESASLYQIELDLKRTFPEHAEFRSARGRARLRRVLRAFVRRVPATGYTQSLNFLAAFLLLQIPERGGIRNSAQVDREEATFWLLCCVVERLLPDYYTSRLTGLQADTRVLEALVAQHPTLHRVGANLERLGLSLSLVSTQWLMLGFIGILPTETTLRVWDLLLPLGPRVLLAAALAAMRLVEAELLEAESFEEAYLLLKNLYRPTLDPDVFVRRLCEELRELPNARLCELRAAHLPDVIEIQTAMMAKTPRKAVPARRFGALRLALARLRGALSRRRRWWLPLLVALAAATVASTTWRSGGGGGATSVVGSQPWRSALTLQPWRWPRPS